MACDERSDDPDEGRQELVLPLHAEEVQISRRTVSRTIRVRSETRTRDVLVNEELAIDSVVVERVAQDRYVDAVPPVRQEGDVTILPVVEEVIVIERRLRLKEEVHVRRVRTSTVHVESLQLREQHAVVTRSEAGPSAPPIAGGATDSTMSIQSNEGYSMNNETDETIVAVYDTAAHAEQAVQDLLAAKVPQNSIHRHTKAGSYGASATEPSQREGGFWSSLFGGEAGQDNTVYDQSMESGGNVVTVKGVPEHDYTAVMDILEKHNPVDLDERAASYGSTATSGMGSGSTIPAAGYAASGSTPAMGAATTSAATTGAAMTGAAMTGAATMGAATMGTATAGAATMGTSRTDVAGGDTMQLSEEALRVGKRVVNRGGTRVRRYVVEKPVEEDVTLRDEKVTLERRPVTDGRPIGDGSFSEKSIEMVETVEEAVVSKTARVVEEVALRKQASERTETVHDTVRKEEVEVQTVPGGTGTVPPKV